MLIFRTADGSLIIDASPSANAALDADTVELVQQIVRTANLHLRVTTTNSTCQAVGVDPATLKRTKIIVEFLPSKDHMRNHKYVHAWTQPGVPDKIFFDEGMLKRFKSIRNNSDAVEERNRIILFLAWKFVHELSHLGFRWKHGQRCKSPPEFHGESGEYVETAMLGGLAGFIFSGANEWNGDQEVSGLVLTRSHRSRKRNHRVLESFIKNVLAQVESSEPVLNDLYPVRVEDSREIRLEGGEHLCSGAAGNDGDDEGTEETDEHLLGVGEHFSEASCGTHEFYLPTGTQE